MTKVIDAEIIPKKAARKGDGGTYLVVADDSDEFKVALKYASQIAKNHRAHLGILRIIEDQDFQHWGGVEKKMKKEMREQGEKYLWSVAKTANEFNGLIPSLYFAEGEPGEALLKVIEADDHIVQLVLGGAADHHNPGHLVNFCMGKGLSRLNVPVVVVPGHLKEFS